MSHECEHSEGRDRHRDVYPLPRRRTAQHLQSHKTNGWREWHMLGETFLADDEFEEPPDQPGAELHVNFDASQVLLSLHKRKRETCTVQAGHYALKQG